MNVIDLLRSHGIDPGRPVSASKGGEYHSGCPGCGDGGKKDSDRFHVWPAQNEGMGSYWCRQCGTGGDNIQFLIDFEGHNYHSACARLGREPGNEADHLVAPARPGKKTGPAWAPKEFADPALVWREKAAKMVEWCHEQLTNNQQQLDYLTGRGITLETVQAFRLGWNPKDQFRPRESWGLETVVKDGGKKKKLWIPAGLVIPRFDPAGVVDRIRIRLAEPRRPESPKYFIIPGSSAAPLILGPVDGLAWVITEAELDGLLVKAAAGDLVTVCALGSSSNRPDDLAAAGLRAALCILDALDYDGAGGNESKFWKENFPQVERWPVPEGKDPGEAFEAGVDIREWILAGLPPRWRVGRSRKLPQGGVAQEAAAVAQEETQPEKASPEVSERGLPAGVVELARLLKGSPVSIVNQPMRISIVFDQRNWEHKSPENWERFASISELLFHDSEVYWHVRGLPTGRYRSRNLANV